MVFTFFSGPHHKLVGGNALKIKYNISDKTVKSNFSQSTNVWPKNPKNRMTVNTLVYNTSIGRVLKSTSINQFLYSTKIGTTAFLKHWNLRI